MKNVVMEVVEAREPMALSELGPQMVEVVKKEREEMHRVCLFHSAGFRELMDEHEVTHWESSLVSLDLVLNALPYNV